MRMRMTWHKKQAPKPMKWLFGLIVGAFFAALIGLTLWVLGSPVPIVTEREIPVNEKRVYFEEGSSRAELYWTSP